MILHNSNYFLISYFYDICISFFTLLIITLEFFVTFIILRATKLKKNKNREFINVRT